MNWIEVLSAEEQSEMQALIDGLPIEPKPSLTDFLNALWTAYQRSLLRLPRKEVTV